MAERYSSLYKYSHVRDNDLFFILIKRVIWYYHSLIVQATLLIGTVSHVSDGAHGPLVFSLMLNFEMFTQDELLVI